MIVVFLVAVIGSAAVLAAIEPAIARDLAIWAAITGLTATAAFTWLGGAL